MCFASSPAALWKFVSAPHLQAKKTTGRKKSKSPSLLFPITGASGPLVCQIRLVLLSYFSYTLKITAVNKTNSSCHLLSLSAQFYSKGSPFSTASALSLNYDWRISHYFKGLGVIFHSLHDRPLRRKMKVSACLCCTSSSLWACQPKLLRSNHAITRPVLEERLQIPPTPPHSSIK